MPNDNNSYKLTQAEFKGKVLESLDNIRGNIGELKEGMAYSNTEITAVKVELANKVCKEDIRAIQSQINSIKLVSSTFGVVAGIASGFAALLLRK